MFDQISADWPMIIIIYLLLLRSTMTTIFTKIDEATQPQLAIHELMDCRGAEVAWVSKEVLCTLQPAPWVSSWCWQCGLVRNVAAWLSHSQQTTCHKLCVRAAQLAAHRSEATQTFLPASNLLESRNVWQTVMCSLLCCCPIQSPLEDQ